jgi:hypothetical protein
MINTEAVPPTTDTIISTTGVVVAVNFTSMEQCDRH